MELACNYGELYLKIRHSYVKLVLVFRFFNIHLADPKEPKFFGIQIQPTSMEGALESD